jgi:hypothetical protein
MIVEELIGIFKNICEGGFTWQETIVVSLAIIGMALSIIVLTLGIVRGITTIVSLFMKTVDKAIDKISTRSKTDNQI